eukprot:5741192-Ditylum_brightwellii.AAC.1
MIVSAYRVCDNCGAQAGPTTCWKQQWRYLQKKGYKEPNPRPMFLRDFQKFIDKCHANNEEPIIGIDANDTDDE